LSKLDFDIAASSVNVTLPPLKFGEAELFYDLFETVYFQVGAISRRIFSPSVLDETKGFIVNASNFTADANTQQTTVNGAVEKSGIQQSLNNQASSKLVPQFDTYSVTVSPFSDLVNK
jgi:ABC-type phosphate/phosphonate transport system permease subunit